MIKYNLELYPRVLYVEIISNESINDIINKFYTINGDDIDFSEFNNYNAGVLRVIKKSTKELAYIAVFKPENISISNIAHEAYHIADALLEDTGMEYNYNSGNEHIAYLVGYVASLIDKGLKRLMKE